MYDIDMKGRYMNACFIDFKWSLKRSRKAALRLPWNPAMKWAPLMVVISFWNVCQSRLRASFTSLSLMILSSINCFASTGRKKNASLLRTSIITSISFAEKRRDITFPTEVRRISTRKLSFSEEMKMRRNPVHEEKHMDINTREQKTLGHCTSWWLHASSTGATGTEGSALVSSAPASALASPSAVLPIALASYAPSALVGPAPQVHWPASHPVYWWAPRPLCSGKPCAPNALASPAPSVHLPAPSPDPCNCRSRLKHPPCFWLLLGGQPVASPWCGRPITVVPG